MYYMCSLLKMPAAITAAPSNIAVSSSVGEANLEVRRSKFDVLEAILRASGGHHGDIWDGGLSWGSCKLCQPNLVYKPE